MARYDQARPGGESGSFSPAARAAFLSAFRRFCRGKWANRAGLALDLLAELDPPSFEEAVQAILLKGRIEPGSRRSWELLLECLEGSGAPPREVDLAARSWLNTWRGGELSSRAFPAARARWRPARESPSHPVTAPPGTPAGPPAAGSGARRRVHRGP